jgi:hypothetical protein
MPPAAFEGVISPLEKFVMKECSEKTLPGIQVDREKSKERSSAQPDDGFQGRCLR